MVQEIPYQLRNLSEEASHNVTTVTHKYQESTGKMGVFPFFFFLKKQKGVEGDGSPASGIGNKGRSWFAYMSYAFI